jgi:hypothetical protein
MILGGYLSKDVKYGTAKVVSCLRILVKDVMVVFDVTFV